MPVPSLGLKRHLSHYVNLNKSLPKSTYYMIPIIWQSRTGKSIQTESRFVTTQGWIDDEGWLVGMTVEGYVISLWGDKALIKSAVVVVTHLQIMKSHWIQHFKWVNSRVYGLHFNRAVRSRRGCMFSTMSLSASDLWQKRRCSG